MFSFLGRWTATHPWLTCSLWLLLGALLTLIAPDWDTRAQDDDIHFLPDRCDSVRGYQLLGEAFPQDVYASRVAFALERSERALSDQDLTLAQGLVAELEALRTREPDLQIGRIASYQDPFIGRRFLSADGRCTLIQVALATPFLAVQTQATVDRAETLLRERLAHAGPDVPQLYVTGAAGVGRDLVRASANSLDRTTLATILLVVVVLLLVYRAPLLALVPLVTIGVSVWVALKVLALFTLIPGVYLVNVSKVFAVVLLYGAGTDYCLFLISRYREELANGYSLPGAVQRSVRTVGGALAASAGTVICGLGLMGFADFAKVRCAGPAIALSLAVALAASLTLAPALLHLLGRRAFWPRGVPDAATARAQVGIWEGISRFVVARPATVLAASLALLLPLALVGLKVQSNYKPTGELSPRSDSVKGLAAIQRHFTAGEVGPITLLLTSATDWNSPQGRRLIDRLSRGLCHLENVAEVRSLTQPLGAPLHGLPGQSLQTDPHIPLSSLVRVVRQNVDGVLDQATRLARDYFTAALSSGRHVARLDVVLKSDPFAAESAATLGVLQAWLRDELPRTPEAPADLATECYGVTVNARDLAQVTQRDRTRINWLVLGGIFIILVVFVRRIWLAAYLLGTVLLSYCATLGATALAGTLWNGRPLGQVDWRVPFFLFTILIAVGEDYNLLLVMRVLQERRRHGMAEGIQRALAHTGGAITSCGLIMAGTFATLMLAELGTLVQMGFALALGVLLDTFLVRPLLVPAFMMLVWRTREAPRQEVADSAVRRAA